MMWASAAVSFASAIDPIAFAIVVAGELPVVIAVAVDLTVVAIVDAAIVRLRDLAAICFVYYRKTGGIVFQNCYKK